MGITPVLRSSMAKIIQWPGHHMTFGFDEETEIAWVQCHDCDPSGKQPYLIKCDNKYEGARESIYYANQHIMEMEVQND